MSKKPKEPKCYSVRRKGMPFAVFDKKPLTKKQDRRAKPYECYAVIFFPKITGMGPAKVNFYGVRESIANTPLAAKVKFLDGIIGGWRTYSRAGHRVRRIKIIDLGDA